jgi:hypothetical protein
MKSFYLIAALAFLNVPRASAADSCSITQDQAKILVANMCENFNGFHGKPVNEAQKHCYKFFNTAIGDINSLCEYKQQAETMRTSLTNQIRVEGIRGHTDQGDDFAHEKSVSERAKLFSDNWSNKYRAIIYVLEAEYKEYQEANGDLGKFGIDMALKEVDECGYAGEYASPMVLGLAYRSRTDAETTYKNVGQLMKNMMNNSAEDANGLMKIFDQNLTHLNNMGSTITGGTSKDPKLPPPGAADGIPGSPRDAAVSAGGQTLLENELKAGVKEASDMPLHQSPTLKAGLAFVGVDVALRLLKHQKLDVVDAIFITSRVVVAGGTAVSSSMSAGTSFVVGTGIEMGLNFLEDYVREQIALVQEVRLKPYIAYAVNYLKTKNATPASQTLSMDYHHDELNRWSKGASVFCPESSSDRSEHGIPECAYKTYQDPKKDRGCCVHLYTDTKCYGDGDPRFQKNVQP